MKPHIIVARRAAARVLWAAMGKRPNDSDDHHQLMALIHQLWPGVTEADLGGHSFADALRAVAHAHSDYLSYRHPSRR